MPIRSMPLVERTALALVMAVLVAACQISGAVVGVQSWTVGATDDLGNSLTVDVNDRSGLVRDIALDPQQADQVLGVAAVPGSPDTFDVSWAGNACNQHATLDLAPAGAGLAITVRVAPSAVPCDNSVVRTLRLTLRQVIAPAMVVMHRDPGG